MKGLHSPAAASWTMTCDWRCSMAWRIGVFPLCAQPAGGYGDGVVMVMVMVMVHIRQREATPSGQEAAPGLCGINERLKLLANECK